MAEHVCPWWLAYTFDNPLRSIFHRPEKLLGAYVREGMTVMDVGCGMGFFSIGMARMVGDDGCVIAVDLQEKMLEITMKRAEKQKVSHRIKTVKCKNDGIGVKEKIDFCQAFWMVHEVPDKAAFFREASSILKPGGRLLMAEPGFHVSERDFQASVSIALENGLKKDEPPRVRFSRAALFCRDDI